MYRCCFILMFFLTCGVSQANTNEITATTQTLEQLPPGHADRVPHLLTLARYYIYREPAKAADIAEQLVSISERINDDISLAQGLRLQGQAELFIEGKKSAAFAHLHQALEVANKTQNPHLISVANRALGVFYELILDFDKALSYYLTSLNYAGQSDRPEDLAMIYNNLGNVLNTQGNHQEAADYFSQSMRLNRQLGDIEMEMNAMVGLGAAHLKAGNLSQAQQALETAFNTESLTMGFILSEAKVNLAHVARLRGDFVEAIERYEDALDDEEKSRYPPAIADAYLGLATTLQQTGQIDRAREVYARGLQEFQDKTSVDAEMALFVDYAELEYREKNYQAAATIQAAYIKRLNEIPPLTQKGLVASLESLLEQQSNVVKLNRQLLASEREAKNSSFYLFAVVVFAMTSLVLILILRLRKQSMLRLESSNQVLRKASETDPLTGIGNRRYLKKELQEQCDITQTLAFLLLDVDHFKTINDKYGHTEGDKVLVTLAATVKKLCRKDELFARIGGEEFVVILPDIDQDAAIQFAERIRSSVELMTTNIDEPITASIGLAFARIADFDFDALYKQADDALYHAKNLGRNKVSVYHNSKKIEVDFV
jgi:diguanylate cyclase (GGDEF)-like protein